MVFLQILTVILLWSSQTILKYGLLWTNRQKIPVGIQYLYISNKKFKLIRIVTLSIFLEITSTSTIYLGKNKLYSKYSSLKAILHYIISIGIMSNWCYSNWLILHIISLRLIIFVPYGRISFLQFLCKYMPHFHFLFFIKGWLINISTKQKWFISVYQYIHYYI